MTPFFDRLDFASDIDFLWDVAMLALALAGVCAAVMLARRVLQWAGRRRARPMFKVAQFHTERDGRHTICQWWWHGDTPEGAQASFEEWQRAGRG